MLTLKDLFDILDEYAPIELSHKCVEKGDYDNSGIIVGEHEKVQKVLFSLDLSEKSVKRAKRLGCDTIVTHHPAIYYPIKNLNETNVASPVLEAIREKKNVISMHLNLDVCDKGIDYYLAEALGGYDADRLDKLTEKDGYGRIFNAGVKLKEIADRIEKKLKTKKIVVYGKKEDAVLKIASFCGAGGGYAEKELFKGSLNADLVITSDMPHHIIKEFIEADKKVIIIPHYASENYGFNKFYEAMTEKLSGKAQTCYFEDKRFL